MLRPRLHAMAKTKRRLRKNIEPKISSYGTIFLLMVGVNQEIKFDRTYNLTQLIKIVLLTEKFVVS